MAAKVTVQLRYEDNSGSMSLQYFCADTHPSGEIIRDLEQEAMRTWEAAGKSIRGVVINTTVRKAT